MTLPRTVKPNPLNLPSTWHEKRNPRNSHIHFQKAHRHARRKGRDKEREREQKRKVATQRLWVRCLGGGNFREIAEVSTLPRGRDDDHHPRLYTLRARIYVCTAAAAGLRARLGVSGLESLETPARTWRRRRPWLISFSLASASERRSLAPMCGTTRGCIYIYRYTYTYTKSPSVFYIYTYTAHYVLYPLDRCKWPGLDLSTTSCFSFSLCGVYNTYVPAIEMCVCVCVVKYYVAVQWQLCRGAATADRQVYRIVKLCKSLCTGKNAALERVCAALCQSVLFNHSLILVIWLWCILHHSSWHY